MINQVKVGFSNVSLKHFRCPHPNKGLAAQWSGLLTYVLMETQDSGCFSPSTSQSVRYESGTKLHETKCIYCTSLSCGTVDSRRPNEREELGNTSQHRGTFLRRAQRPLRTRVLEHESDAGRNNEAYFIFKDSRPDRGVQTWM